MHYPWGWFSMHSCCWVLNTTVMDMKRFLGWTLLHSWQIMGDWNHHHHPARFKSGLNFVVKYVETMLHLFEETSCCGIHHHVHTHIHIQRWVAHDYIYSGCQVLGVLHFMSCISGVCKMQHPQNLTSRVNSICRSLDCCEAMLSLELSFLLIILLCWTGYG